MEEQQEQQKACLIEHHSNNFLSSGCIDKNCENKSKVMCQQCILNKEEFHNNCHTFLEFIGEDYDKLKVHYTKSFYSQKLEEEDNNLKNILENMEQDKVEKFKELEQKSIIIIEQYASLVNMKKKEIRIQIEEDYRQIKEDIEELQKKKEQFENLNNLECKFKLLREGGISIQEFNDNLCEKQKQSFDPNKYELIKLDFNQKNYKSEKAVSNFENQIENYLKLIPQDNKNQDILIQSFKSYILKEQAQKQEFISNKCFQSSQNIKFSFQISSSSETEDTMPLNFGIGIIPCNNPHGQESNFLHSPYKIFLNNQNHYYSKNETNTPIHQVFKNNQIYNIEICYDSNIFQITDRNQESMISQNQNFDERYYSWQLWVKMWGGTKLEILSIE